MPTTDALPDSITDYDFALPSELIAQSPSAQRDEARLLVVRRDPTKGMPRYEDLSVRDLPALARSEPALRRSLWVRNRSKVIPARFYARRPSGGRHEIVLLREEEPGLWSAIVRNIASFRYPQQLFIEASSNSVVTQSEPIELSSPAPNKIDFGTRDVLKLLERVGEMPLPPYIHTREPTRDRERYQSVWARDDKAASAAAPTASLHFTPELCAALEEAGASFADLVLHVGLGTFEPLRQNSLSAHALHAERLEVEATTVRQLEEHCAAKQPIVCVGTTALRCLESLPLNGAPTPPEAQLRIEGSGNIRGETRLFVRPGFNVRYATALLTNFHLPQSTLLVLLCTFCKDRELVLNAYKHAVAKGYRFFSFGDASLWL